MMPQFPNLPDNIVGYVAILIGSITAFLRMLIPARRRNFEALTDRQEKYADRHEADLERLHDRLDREEKDHDHCKAENERLRASIMYIQSSQMDIPLPLWIKDMDGILISCNKAYEDQFLKPIGITAQDYIGRPDWEIWGKEFAKKIAAHERQLVVSRKELRGTDYIPVEEGKTVKTSWIKYPLFKNGTMIGHAGIITETSYE